jgi:diguanylate cyclase
MGCAYGQGYHFARPMPGPALADFLAARATAVTAAPAGG